MEIYCASLKKHREPIPKEGQEILGQITLPLAG